MALAHLAHFILIQVLNMAVLLQGVKSTGYVGCFQDRRVNRILEAFRASETNNGEELLTTVSSSTNQKTKRDVVTAEIIIVTTNSRDETITTGESSFNPVYIILPLVALAIVAIIALTCICRRKYRTKAILIRETATRPDKRDTVSIVGQNESGNNMYSQICYDMAVVYNEIGHEGQKIDRKRNPVTDSEYNTVGSLQNKGIVPEDTYDHTHAVKHEPNKNRTLRDIYSHLNEHEHEANGDTVYNILNGAGNPCATMTDMTYNKIETRFHSDDVTTKYKCVQDI